MLKGKSLSYALITIVVCIWGVLIYQFVDGFSDTVSTPNISKSSFKPKNETKNEKFDLLPIEKDPFLGIATNKKPSKKKIYKKKKIVQWPQLRYLGMVASSKGKSKIFIAQISGVQHLLETGQEVDGIRLIRGTKEKIRLRYKGQTKEISQ